MLDDILCELDTSIGEWYKRTDKSNKIAALTIGMNVVLSNNYKDTETSIVNTLKEKINLLEIDHEVNLRKLHDSYENELKMEKDSKKELESKFEIDNRHSIEVAIDVATKYIREHNSTLKEDNMKIEESLKKLKEDYNILKCNMKTSKTKGDITEQEVRNVIESNGFRVIKPGNHSGDLFVYSSDSEDLLCILEIKNYGDDNKHKLGPNGSETKKMYNDIETQLKSKNSINVPWIFISLGCVIPNIKELRTSHCGVRCVYLEFPTNNEIIAYINCCEQVSLLNHKTNDKNIVYMQQKINEIYDIFNKLRDDRPDFNVIKEFLNKAIKKLEKEASKYNKILEDTINRVNEIIKNVKYTPDIMSDIDYTINTGDLSIDGLKEYVGRLQRNGIKLNNDLNNIKFGTIDEGVDSINSNVLDNN
jgi:hypothetical protein